MNRIELIETIRATAAEARGRRLPTLRIMAADLGVSLRMIQQAVRQLRDEGVLDVGVRAGIRSRIPSDDHTVNITSAVPAEERLYKIIYERIESGMYKTGEPFPKASYIAATERAGKPMVLRVLRRLVHEGFAVRYGRDYIAGSGVSTGSKRVARSVLIIQQEHAGWDRFALSSWTRCFAGSLMRELSMAGIQAHTVLPDRVNDGIRGAESAAGREEIGALIESLGKGLLGSLVVSYGLQPSLVWYNRSLDFIEWLGRFDHPIVLFDHLSSLRNAQYHYEVNEPFNVFTARSPQKSRLVRCDVDLWGVHALPVTELHLLGHRVVGFPFMGQSYRWTADRLKFLRSAADNMRVTIMSDAECPRLFAICASEPIRIVFSQIRAALRQPHADRVIDELMRNAPTAKFFSDLPAHLKELVQTTALLGGYLNRTECTALIAPDDRSACIMYRWLKAAGVRIPDDLSLVSFDDSIEDLYPYIISSVNFGFDNLGYTAAHMLIGDLKVKLGKDGTVTGRFKLNHRATIGARHSLKG